MPSVYSLNWTGSILKKRQLTLLKQSFSGPFYQFTHSFGKIWPMLQISAHLHPCLHLLLKRLLVAGELWELSQRLTDPQDPILLLVRHWRPLRPR